MRNDEFFDVDLDVVVFVIKILLKNIGEELNN